MMASISSPYKAWYKDPICLLFGVFARGPSFSLYINDCLHRKQSDESETDQSDINWVKFTARLSIVYIYECY